LGLELHSLKRESLAEQATPRTNTYEVEPEIQVEKTYRCRKIIGDPLFFARYVGRVVLPLIIDVHGINSTQQ
jgi:hypothetical protein